jgi:hypothetical protein
MMAGSKCSQLLDVLRELANDVASWVVLADHERSFAVHRIKDTITGSDGATNLRGGLPHHLGKVRVLWVVGVIVAGLVTPGGGSVGDGRRSSCGVEVFTVRASLSSRVLEDTSVSPALSGVGEFVAPCQRAGVVLSTEVVVALEPGVNIRTRFEFLDGTSNGKRGKSDGGKDNGEAGHSDMTVVILRGG